MKRVLLALFWLILTLPLYGNERAQGFCQQGGQRVLTSGILSQGFVQAG